MEDSRLPQLSPPRSASHAANSSAIQNPARLKRELKRLYPRVQSIEREIGSIKQYFPANTGKLLLQLTRDVATLRTPGATFSDDTDQPPDLTSELAELESRVLQALEFKISNSASTIERRLHHLEQTGPGAALLAEQIDWISDNSALFDRIQRLERSFNSQLKQTQIRISSLDKSVSRALATQADRSVDQELTAVSADVKGQRQRLTELQRKVRELKSDVTEAPQPQPGQSALLHEPDPEVPVAIGAPIDDFRREIQSYQEKVDQTIMILNEKVVTFGQKLESVSTIAAQLSETTTTLERRIRDAANVSAMIVDDMEALAGKVDDAESQRILASLMSKLQTANEGIKSQVGALQRSIEKCQTAVTNPSDSK
jgi:predicted  nucleic acid-binding Zn-ribbon protein